MQKTRAGLTGPRGGGGGAEGKKGKDDLDDIFVDARMEGCERMTTLHGWLQRRSGWAGWTDMFPV